MLYNKLLGAKTVPDRTVGQVWDTAVRTGVVSTIIVTGLTHFRCLL